MRSRGLTEVASGRGLWNAPELSAKPVEGRLRAALGSVLLDWTFCQQNESLVTTKKQFSYIYTFNTYIHGVKYSRLSQHQSA